MKKYIKHICSCIVVVLIFVIICMAFSALVRRKASAAKYKDFFEQEEKFDVLLLGNSHMWNGVFPMDLWHYNGIVSYNLAGPGNRMATNYWIMMNAFDYTSPELVVVDCSGIKMNEKIPSKNEHVHTSFDSFPLTDTKIDAIKDLFDDTKRRWEFVWDYSIYHNRWNELSEEDFLKTGEFEKGAQSKVGISIPERYDTISSDKKIKRNKVSMDYLYMIIEECKKRDIEVLLTYIPFPADEVFQKEANTVRDIAQEYNVNYVNFLEMDIVNFETDMHDASYLNAAGARKVTEYLGDYIIKNYDIDDQRENEDYAFWNKDYNEYIDYKISLFKDISTLDEYLMLLNDRSFSCAVEFKDEYSKAEDDFFSDRRSTLFDNINVVDDFEIPAVNEELVGDERNYAIRILLIDNRTGRIVDDIYADKDGKILGRYFKQEEPKSDN